MIYKCSFNSLNICVDDVYTAYNLTPNELKDLKRRFGEKISCNNGIYTVYKFADRKIFLELFVHEKWITVQFDIRNDLSRLFNATEIDKNDIKKLSEKLKENRVQLYVEYNMRMNTWKIVDYDNFLVLLEDLIAEL